MIELLYFTLIFFAAFSLGKKIINKFKLSSSFLEIIVFSSAIGLGIFSYIIFFLGIVGMLYKIALLIIILVILILSKNEILYFILNFKNIRKIRKLGKISFMLIVVLCIFAFLNLIASFSPPYLWDEVAYNIALPKIYAKYHKIIPIDYEIRSNFPFNINMLFTGGLLIANAHLSKLFMFAYGTLLAAAIFTFSRRYFSLRVSLLAATIYYTMPMISNHISSTYIDIGVAFYVFMSYYALYLWFESHKQSWFLLSSIMIGLSIASKHTALYYIPALLILIFYNLFFCLKKNMFLTFKKTSFYLLLAFLIASPWYIKSYLYTGDPIFPFGQSLISRNQDFISYNFGEVDIQRSFLDFITKFWDLTMHSSKYAMLLGFGPIFLAFVPLVLLMKRVDRVIKYLLVYSLISFIAWYFNPQGLRYLMIYPMLSVASAHVIGSLCSIRKIRWLVGLALISTLLFNSILWFGANLAKLPYAFGFESEQEFYSKLKDHNGYNVFKYANENLPKSSNLLLFGEVRGYLSNLDYIKSDPLAQKVIDFSKISNGEDMYKKLMQLQITHVFINTNLGFLGRTNPNLPVRYTEREFNLMDETLKTHGRLMFSEKGVYLYELV